jgi:putative aldouronate transport system substrate-binding protein
MKKLQKITCLLLCLCLCLLAACANTGSSGLSSPSPASTDSGTSGSQPPAQSTGEPGGAGPSNAMPIADGTVKLVVAAPDNQYTVKSYAENLPVWKLIEEKTGVLIEWEVIERTKYDEIMSIRIASNADMPDVFKIPAKLKIADLSKQNVILPLDDLMAQYAPNAVANIEKYPITGALGKDMNGKICAFVIYRTGQDANARTPIIRKDWLDKLGLDIPKTLDEFYTVMQRFAHDDPNGNGLADEIAVMNSTYLEAFFFASAFGLPSVPTEFLADENGKVFYTYTSEPYRKTLEFVNKLYNEKLLSPDILTNDNETVESTIPKNIVGIGVQSPGVDIRWDGFVQATGVPEANYVVINPPVDETGKVVAVKKSPIGPIWSISPQCKNPEIAIRWLDYVMFGEGTLYHEWGIPGQSFDLDANGKPYLTEWTLKNPDGLDANSALRSIGAFTPGFSVETIEFMEGKLLPKTVEAIAAVKPNLVDPYLTVSATEEESDIYDSLYTDINTYVTEMLQKFIVGTEPLSKWESFVQTVEKMGLSTLIEIEQAKYDRTYG